MHVARSIYARVTARLFCACRTGCSRCIFHCYLNLCYFYALFIFFACSNVLIYSLFHAYTDLCLSMHNWLISFHKSIPDLGINPSRVMVKLLRAALGFQLDTLPSPFGGIKGPEGSTDFSFTSLLS